MILYTPYSLNTDKCADIRSKGVVHATIKRKDILNIEQILDDKMAGMKPLFVLYAVLHTLGLLFLFF